MQTGDEHVTSVKAVKKNRLIQCWEGFWEVQYIHYFATTANDTILLAWSPTTALENTVAEVRSYFVQ